MTFVTLFKLIHDYFDVQSASFFDFFLLAAVSRKMNIKDANNILLLMHSNFSSPFRSVEVWNRLQTSVVEVVTLILEFKRKLNNVNLTLSSFVNRFVVFLLHCVYLRVHTSAHV